MYDPKADEAYTPPERDSPVGGVMGFRGTGRIADFRSDTVTRPTAEMTIAMIDAQVGDDVYGEDPTVNKLQTHVAQLLGKEAGLFVPSGTMGNLICIAAQAQRGDEVILGDQQHLFVYEQAGISGLFGIGFHTLTNNDDGTFALRPSPAVPATMTPLGATRTLEGAFAARDGGRDPHFARPAVLALENTHNRCGGSVLPQAWVDDATATAKRLGMRVHMDGARLMNAAAATNLPPARLVRDCDTVSLCLSKGLGAPAGSVIVGSKEFIESARRLRKVLGGGMRQAGVLAAPGLVGVKEQAKGLAADHARAKYLARGLAGIPGVVIDARKVATNIVFFNLDAKAVKVDASVAARAGAALKACPNPTERAEAIAAGSGGDPLSAMPDAVLEQLASGSLAGNPAGAVAAILEAVGKVKVGTYGDTRIRAVTHHQVNDDDVDTLLRVLGDAVEALAWAPASA